MELGRVWAPGLCLPATEDCRFVYVAWHRGGSQTLRLGKRHLADTHGARKTLCGQTWRRSAEVLPNDYWTNGTCARCVAAAPAGVG